MLNHEKHYNFHDKYLVNKNDTINLIRKHDFGKK